MYLYDFWQTQKDAHRQTVYKNGQMLFSALTVTSFRAKTLLEILIVFRWHLVPSIWYQIFGTKYLVPSIWYQVSGTKYLVQSTWYQVFGTKYLVPSTWYQVFGTKYLVPTICGIKAVGEAYHPKIPRTGTFASTVNASWFQTNEKGSVSDALIYIYICNICIYTENILGYTCKPFILLLDFHPTCETFHPTYKTFILLWSRSSFFVLFTTSSISYFSWIR